MGFFEIPNYLESFNDRPTLCFQGPRGLRGLQGPMGAVGDRVSDFWNAESRSPRCSFFHAQGANVSFTRSPCVFLTLSPGFAGLQRQTGHRRHHRQDSESLLVCHARQRSNKKINAASGGGLQPGEMAGPINE